MGWQRPGITCECGVVEREGTVRLKRCLLMSERLQNIPARSSNRAPVVSTSFDCLPNFWGTSLRHPRLGLDTRLRDHSTVLETETVLTV
jgi:hypothetical protein